MVAKKKTAKKPVAKKKPVPKKKPVKAKPVAKAAKAAKPAKKKPAPKPAAKKKPAPKAAAKKKPAPRIAKKPAPKTVPKPVAKKTAPVKKVAPAKAAKIAPQKAAKKPAAPEKSGKAQIQAMKSKVFRRSPTDVQPFQPYRVEHGEEYMNAPQREHFRRILLDWKKLLMEEVDRTVHHMQDEAANFPDPNDRATQEEEFALELRTRDRERKLIRKIDEAMISLETGDYGYCEVCGVEIGVKRLEARPTATLCIDCKTLDEIKEKQLG